MSFFSELKRRNVFRAGAAYVITAWLIIQVVETILPSFGFGEAAIRAVVIILTIGLIPVLAIAWAFELTPQGFKRENNVDYSSPVFQQFGRRLDRLVMILLALGLAYFAFDKFILDPTRDAEMISFTRQSVEQEALNRTREKSLAILPFANRSNRPEDEYFTSGIHDDLLTTVAKIGSIKVISRTSVMEYKNTTKKITQIATELNVANILEGGIQRSGNQVRLNVQLIDARTDEHIWAETYDRELTAENLFAIQSDISRSVAYELKANLSPEEIGQLEKVPTNNVAAYESYLRGQQAMVTGEVAEVQSAIEAFKQAVELDPEFALAWVRIADAYDYLAASRTFSLEDSYPIRERAIDRALAIDAMLGEAYASLGSLYADRFQFEEAESTYRKSIQLNPNYARSYFLLSGRLKNDDSRIDEAIEFAQKAADLDPRSPDIALNLGRIYSSRGLYNLAAIQYLKVTEIDPGFAPAFVSLSNLYAFDLGHLDDGYRYALQALELDAENIGAARVLADIFLLLGEMDSAEHYAERIRTLEPTQLLADWLTMKIHLIQGNRVKASELIHRQLPKVKDRWWIRSMLAAAELSLGDNMRARKSYLSANPGWLDPEQWPNLIKFYTYNGCIVSWILIHTGSADLGTELLSQTTAYLDVELTQINEHADLSYPEICHLAARDTEKALLAIETQLKHGHLNDWRFHHLLPMFDLIRDDPRYQTALQERDRRISAQGEAIAIKKLTSEN